MTLSSTLGQNLIKNPSPEVVYSFNDINSQWIDGPVIMDHNFRLHTPIVEIYTYSQSFDDIKYTTEFYDKRRFIARADSTIEVNKNITKLKITLNDELPSTNESLAIYPKVKTINIHSQMSRNLIQDDSKNE